MREDVLTIKFYTLEEAKKVYGEESLIPITQIKQIIFYAKHGLQPKFIWESEKETGKVVFWYHRRESELVYQRWQENKKKINNEVILSHD